MKTNTPPKSLSDIIVEVLTTHKDELHSDDSIVKITDEIVSQYYTERSYFDAPCNEVYLDECDMNELLQVPPAYLGYDSTTTF